MRPTDRPLSCFNRGIEHVQRQLLNTTCPRSPSHPRCPTFSLSPSHYVSVPPSVCRSVLPALPVALRPTHDLFRSFLFFLPCHDRERHSTESQRRTERMSLRFAFFDPPSARRSIADFDFDSRARAVSGDVYLEGKYLEGKYLYFISKYVLE